MFWRKLRRLFSGSQAELDLREETALHLALRAKQLREAGMSEGDARAESARQFGNRALVEEDVRAAWNWRWFEHAARDFRVAARTLMKNAPFSAVAIVSLAAAMAVNTSVFRFARAIVMEMLPVKGADRLVILRQHNEMFHMENCCFSLAFFRNLAKHDVGFEKVIVATPTEFHFTDGNYTERLQAELVSDNYFQTLGVRAALGSLIDEHRDGAVCVISNRLWRDRFGGRADAIGKRVLLAGAPFQIIGVTEPGFQGLALHEAHDIEVPASATRALFGGGPDSFGWAQIVARLRPGVTVEQAASRLNAIGIEIEKQEGMQFTPKDAFRLEDGSQGLGSRREQLGKPVMLVFGLAGLVLAVACANLAALLWVRSVERGREAGVRLALGASRGALTRHFLTESLTLAFAAGVVGWALAGLLTNALLKMLGPDGEGLARLVQPDAATLAFAFTAAAGSGILFGLWPAWKAAQSDPLRAIRGLDAPRGRAFGSRFLVSAQIALSVTLLFGSGLFVRTLRNMRAIDLGFWPENIALLDLDLSRLNGAQSAMFRDELLRRARALPQTKAASLTRISVISGAMQSAALRIPGYTPHNRITPIAYFMTVSDGYFRTLGTPMIAGRDFTNEDRTAENQEGAAIVNERFARQFLAGDAMGKVFTYAGSRKVRVVGVVKNTRYRSMREKEQPVMYLAMTQGTGLSTMYLQARTTGDPSLAIGKLRAAAREIDSRAALDKVTTMEAQIDDALTRERLLAFLSSVTGVLALVLAAIGLYGVVSYSVARRMREIGIRLAVGASRSAIFGQFLRESCWLAAGGIAVGVPLALALGRLAATLLYGLTGQDMTTAATACVVLAITALVAATIPAIRAARLDPMQSLRRE